MKTSLRLAVLLAFVSLSACAGGPQRSTNAAFEKFQSDIIAQRDAGKITPVQAQVDLWSKYRELFGEDPNMNGFYAYSVKLMSSVEQGKMPLNEAQALIDAREQEISARHLAIVKREMSYDAYGNPP
ncbi:MAG TPA: hypothetical protein VHB46_20495 [Burkholderiales bacterium]|nr:hypothetical protein [Burkholderiales bacterium]